MERSQPGAALSEPVSVRRSSYLSAGRLAKASFVTVAQARK